MSDLTRVDVVPDEDGTWLSVSTMDAETGESDGLSVVMNRRERLWLVRVLLRGLWRR